MDSTTLKRSLQESRTSASSRTETVPRVIVASERAAALLREELESLGLSDYFISFCRDLELHDLDQHLDAIVNAAPADSVGTGWRSAPSLAETESIDGEPLSIVAHRAGSPHRWNGGFLHLPRFGVVIARWFYLTPERDEPTASITLIGAGKPESVTQLRAELQRLRRRRAIAMWQIVSGASYLDDPAVARDLQAGDELVLPPALRERVTIDVVRFFSDEVAALYRTLGVACRRGVLLYGPPGNGKTSLIRWIGASLPHIPAMLLRPKSGFDSDDLEEVIRRWKRQAPALLVIEDLDWLMKDLNVSQFLNLLDGIDTNAVDTPGLLLIATTNHPEKLDPAINSRPGRFDVVIEVPSPTAVLRLEFLHSKLPTIDKATLREVVRIGDRFSFAHLHELLRLSGLYAIAADRPERTNEDVLRAASEVANGLDNADRGFAPKPDVPFGLEALRVLKRGNGCQST